MLNECLREKFGHDATAREVTQSPIMINLSSFDNADNRGILKINKKRNAKIIFNYNDKSV